MLAAFNPQKFRFWSFVSMFLLVFVHAYNLNISYLAALDHARRTTHGYKFH